jgi:hypothetical protein
VRSIQSPRSDHSLAIFDPPGRPGAAPRRIDWQVLACASAVADLMRVFPYRTLVQTPDQMTGTSADRPKSGRATRAREITVGVTG